MDTEPQHQAWTFAEGATVLGADGEKVGQVIAVYADYVVVEKGFFFPTDYYVPTRSVATYD
ncbi:MAG: YsnF/AvaK domain-containing protein, partial [Thermomicrobiales bacterium]